MNKIILFIAFLISGNLFAQTKDKTSVNVGLYRTDLYSKLFLYDKFCDEGCYTTEQHAVTCFDLNYLRQANIGKKFFIPFGFGINQKGYSEKGFVNNLNENWDPYSATYKATYLSFYIGISYDLNVCKKLTINIGQLLNPKMLGGGDSEYKVIPISTRTNFSFQFNSSKKISLQATPFFETAITPYSKSKFNGQYYYWRPFGYGITVGILW
jgi:hypothetical protein